MRKTEIEKLRKKASPAKYRWDYRDYDVWEIVEQAYEKMEREDLFLSQCLDGLTHFERELVRAAFAVGRRSYAEECDEDKEIMKELGLT